MHLNQRRPNPLPRGAILGILSLALAGCCSPAPNPDWVSTPPNAPETELQTLGQSSGQESPEAALAEARRVAARRAAAEVLGARADDDLLQRLGQNALEVGTTVERFQQGCERYEAAVLMRWNRAALKGLSAAVQRTRGEELVDTERLRRSGRSLLAEGKPVEAAAAFRRLSRARPKDAEAHLLLGEAIRADLARPGVPRAEGGAQALQREADRAYALAASLGGDDDLQERVMQGRSALVASSGDAWRKRFQDLVRRVLAGKRAPEEALSALVRAVTPDARGTARSFLQEKALDVESYALTRALVEALPPGARVAVLEPEWPHGQRDDAAAAALQRLGALIGASLVDAHLIVRTPQEVDARLKSARVGPPAHAQAYEPDGRARLREHLESEYVVLIVGGQRATATAYDLRQGTPLAPVGRVYHPTGEAWSGVKEPNPLRAEVTFLGQKLDDEGKLEADLRISDGTELRIGDQLQCRVRLEQPSYTYLIWCDSQGKVWRVFPETERVLPGAPQAAKNPLPTGVHQIPGGTRDLFFTLAGEPGRETLYLVAARRPVRHLAELERALADGEVQDPRQTLRRFLSQQAGQARGLSSTRAGQGSPESIVLEGPDLVVRELTYRLRAR
tara:strand:+ start:71 stop:1936 length:1866 start_codon:yes stop_codon:yes gene_type:complete